MYQEIQKHPLAFFDWWYWWVCPIKYLVNLSIENNKGKQKISQIILLPMDHLLATICPLNDTVSTCSCWRKNYSIFLEFYLKLTAPKENSPSKEIVIPAWFVCFKKNVFQIFHDVREDFFPNNNCLHNKLMPI